MTSPDFKCPHCQQRLETPANLQGQALECPICHQPISLPAPGARPAAPGAAAPAAPHATWSLVLGILGWTCFGLLAAIPAVICGHLALGRIKSAAGALGGHGLAIAGLVLGYVNIALSVLAFLVLIPLGIISAKTWPSILRWQHTVQANICIHNLHQIETAKNSYAREHGLTNGAAISWDAMAPDTGGLQEWPRCPASTLTPGAASRAGAEADYELNPIGVNAACRQGGGSEPPHKL